VGWRWVWWWCAILFGLQLVAFTFGFEETKYQHFETLEDRQGSIVSARAGVLQDLSMDSKGEKQAFSALQPTDTEDGHRVSVTREDVRKLSTIHINPNIKRKPYLQRLSLLTTSPGKWSHFLRHSWQPFMILGSIPGVLFCSLCYAVLLAYQTVQTTALSTYMLLPPYNFTAAQIGLMSLPPFIGNTRKCNGRQKPPGVPDKC
jgi:hypothetical protein